MILLGRGRALSRPAREAGPAERFDAVADATAELVIKRYSTSFGVASRLLAEPVRTRTRNVYALVRVADELVDAPRPGATDEDRRRLLNALEGEVATALSSGHSANLVVHAFVRTARACDIGPDLIEPFFSSMACDLDRTTHDQDSFARYVYGSAEVVGLMCLKVFLADEPDRSTAYERLAPGARALGAAFQKVNFLRDLADDTGRLGRQYFPGVDVATFDDRDRDDLLADIERDLTTSASAVERLPASSRRAVRAAHDLFAALARRLADTPAETISTQRIRLPGPVKARVLAGSLVRDAR